MKRPTHETVAGLLQLFAPKGLLSRLAVSPRRQHLILKGGVRLAAMDARLDARLGYPLAMVLA